MVGRKRRPRPAGQIEHLDRVFDAKTDIEDFAAERFGALKTGDWGIRRYLVPPDSRPVFVVLRASDEVQFKGRRVPFHNQLDDITRAMAYRPVKRCVAAVFWDCESARDFRGTGTARRAIERQGFATGLAEAGSPARPCEEIWFWHSDRLARGYRYLPQLLELEQNRVALMSSHGRVRSDFLAREIEYARSEPERFLARAMRGKRTTAEREGRPPTGRVPVGWRRRYPEAATASGARTRHYECVHDPEAMPAWEDALTGLLFGGWTWERASDHLDARGVKRMADRNGQRDARGAGWNPRLLRKSLKMHTWWIGRGTWAAPTTVVDEEGEERIGPREVVSFPVPPAMVDDPRTGRRALTADDLGAIFARTANATGRGYKSDGVTDRALMDRTRCAVCGGGLRHQIVRSRLGDYYLLRCDNPSMARELGRDRCGRRPVCVREARAIDAVWLAVATALLDPRAVGDEARAELATLEAQPVVRDAEGLRRRLEQQTAAEATLLVQRALEPASAPAYEQALARVRTEQRGLKEALSALEQQAHEAVARREELRRTVEAVEAYEAALAGEDEAARARWARAFEVASAEVRRLVIREVVEVAEVQADGTWRVRLHLSGAGESFRALVPDGSDCRTPFTKYKHLPPLVVTRRGAAA